MIRDFKSRELSRTFLNIFQWLEREKKKGQRDATLMALKMERGDHEPRNISSLWKLER